MNSSDAKRIVAFLREYKGEVLVAPVATQAGKAARDAAGLDPKNRKGGDKIVNAVRSGAGLEKE